MCLRNFLDYRVLFPGKEKIRVITAIMLCVDDTRRRRRRLNVLLNFNELELKIIVDLVLVKTIFLKISRANSEFPACVTCHGKLCMRTEAKQINS